VLTPYEASDQPEADALDQAERELEGLLVDIASRVRFRTKVSRHAEGWAARIETDKALPQTADGDCLTLAPHNRASEIYPLDSAALVDVKLPPRDLEDVTAFLQITASRQIEGQTVRRATIVCSQLTGAPDDRHQRILARQIDTPEKFMRLLALLIGFDAASALNAAANGGGNGSWSAGPSEGVLEMLARALAQNPESIDQLQETVENLSKWERGRTVLPEGWDAVWKPTLEARQAMLANQP